MSNVVKYVDTVEDTVYSLEYSPDTNNHDNAISEDNHYITINAELNKANEIIKAAKCEALKLITEAREQANIIIASAENQAAADMENAKSSGYEQGYAEGKLKAQEESRQMIEEIGTLLQNLHIEKNEILKQQTGLIRKLSIGIAKKIIDITLDEDNIAFLNLFRNAVKDYTVGDWVKISTSIHEYDFVTSNTDLLLSMVKGAKYIEAIKLSDMPKGTCIVETSSGIINASVETQLVRLDKAFSNAERAVQYNDCNGEAI